MSLEKFRKYEIKNTSKILGGDQIHIRFYRKEEEDENNTLHQNAKNSIRNIRA